MILSVIVFILALVSYRAAIAALRYPTLRPVGLGLRESESDSSSIVDSDDYPSPQLVINREMASLEDEPPRYESLFATEA